MPRLSVLLPVRDGAATIERAARSTLRAMPRDAELVVWDDGSTDATAEVVDGIRDRRMKALHAADSLGPGGALRRLMEVTDSEWVARMDADDVCAPWRFMVQLRLLRKGGCEYVFSTVVSFERGPNRFRPELPLAIRPDAMPLHLAVTNLLAHPSMVARRDAMEAVGGYREVAAEDYDLWLRACASGQRLARVATPTLAYRRHAGQVSASPAYAALVARDRSLHDSYCAFMQTVLGIVVSPQPNPEGWYPTADPVLVRTAVGERAARLGPVQRALVERTLRLLPADGEWRQA